LVTTRSAVNSIFTNPEKFCAHCSFSRSGCTQLPSQRIFVFLGWSLRSFSAKPAMQMFTQFFLTSPSTLNRKVRHKNAALSAQVRRRVRSMSS
jgi:hypothetical protein